MTIPSLKMNRILFSAPVLSHRILTYETSNTKKVLPHFSALTTTSALWRDYEPRLRCEGSGYLDYNYEIAYH